MLSILACGTPNERGFRAPEESDCRETLATTKVMKATATSFLIASVARHTGLWEGAVQATCPRDGAPRRADPDRPLITLPYKHTRTHVYRHVLAHAHTHTHTHVLTHTHTHTHIHHTHTYTQTDTLAHARSHTRGVRTNTQRMHAHTNARYLGSQAGGQTGRQTDG